MWKVSMSLAVRKVKFSLGGQWCCGNILVPASKKTIVFLSVVGQCQKKRVNNKAVEGVEHLSKAPWTVGVQAKRRSKRHSFQ